MNQESGIKDREPSHNSFHIVVVAIAALFAIGTSVLSWGNARANDLTPRFHWPDETSNAYFAERIARGGSFVVPEDRNIGTGNIVHPRTVNVRDDGALVPGSYLGLPLWYGLISRAFGARAMLFVTPVLAALGILAFAFIVRMMFGARIAFLATALLALHPSIWFFTATAFLPNAPFIALLLVGFAVLFAGIRHQMPDVGPIQEQARRAFYFLLFTFYFSAGLLIGLALTIRTHEIIWVFALTVVMIWRQTVVRWWVIVYRLSSIVFGIVLPFIPILILNTQLYGSPFTTGYSLLHEGGALPTEFAQSPLPATVAVFVAPFGWYPIRAFVFAWQYIIAPYWWLMALAIIGMIVERRRRVFLIGTFALTIWLLLFYGSWLIADPLVRTTNVFTISYVRYWLPITIALAPWAAVGFLWIVERMRASWRPYFAGVLVIAIALSVFPRIVNDPIEGLRRQWSALAEHRVRARAIIAVTEPNAVIISDRMDKVFFPERAVIHASQETARDPGFMRDLRALIERAPVYWYSPSEVAVRGFALTEVAGAPYGERLYAIH